MGVALRVADGRSEQVSQRQALVPGHRQASGDAKRLQGAQGCRRGPDTGVTPHVPRMRCSTKWCTASGVFARSAIRRSKFATYRVRDVLLRFAACCAESEKRYAGLWANVSLSTSLQIVRRACLMSVSQTISRGVFESIRRRSLPALRANTELQCWFITRNLGLFSKHATANER